eukprot:CAMPEP_0172557302 /NCGR_PEP_ID=MMETSP1067-20121228/72535_1 /TAXON_ID=265564 ORGANISM="Thalassiosira punctigera, Strain Tpunct2005C2" /NCGR_SAMPLE_ID=MMETSP1067 /ASSEMBLY_ACC=CAM_ASM_000444 /LENGTH=305 /DNA_ID=CAMNT_0013346357 /DNA_START=23 /DNA_END=936 /DNA_ORIENTATION=+
MVTYSNVLHRRTAAFSSLVWNHSAKNSRSSAARQHHGHARQTTISPPRDNPFLVTPRRPCPAHDKQNSLSRCHSTASSTHLFMTSDDDEDSGEMSEVRTSFNIQVLKKETTRLILRAHKMVGKVSVRIRAAEEQYDRLRLAIDESSSDEMDERLMQQMEQAPNVEQYQLEMKELQDRLQKLNWLEERFGKSPLKSKKTMSAEEMRESIPEGGQVARYVNELEISDDDSKKQKLIEANERNRRSKKERQATLKQQNQKQGGRLPYRRYYTERDVEVRVGKQATDNDVLSLSPEHRSGSHWWYHASG